MAVPCTHAVGPGHSEGMRSGPTRKVPIVLAMALPPNPLQSVIDRQGTVVLDGGLATALEAHGCNLDHELWSAKVLQSSPELIRQVHLEFLRAGADCITSATYQASIAGFAKHGIDETEARRLFTLATELAVEARNEFLKEDAAANRARPLVAASIGPYGAYLADGSEYRGQYGVSDEELREFHLTRWEVLAASGADLLACETIPCHRETEVLLDLLTETPDLWAWMSFTCKDDTDLRDGVSFTDVVHACDSVENVAAIGINCTSPEFVWRLLDLACAHTDKPLIVYSNSGETYDTKTRSWVGATKPLDYPALVAEWKDRSAAGIGGCCRVTADDIATIREAALAPE